MLNIIYSNSLSIAADPDYEQTIPTAINRFQLGLFCVLTASRETTKPFTTGWSWF